MSKILIVSGAFLILQTSTAFGLGQRLPEVNPGPAPAPGGEETLREVIPLWNGKVSAAKDWTAHVDRELDRIGSDLLETVPADKNTFCPKYQNLSHAQRKQFWTFLISSMVRFESNFKTDSAYTEDFNDSSGKKVISRGLLQISIESGNAYGCGFKTTKDLHDPYQNLSCGVRILNRWMANDERIAGKVNGSWKGGARYWSVLRTTSGSYSSIQSWSRALSICN